MEQIEFEAIEILKRNECLPVDIYIELNNSGINPESLISLFRGKEEKEEEKEEKDHLNNLLKQYIGE